MDWRCRVCSPFSSVCHSSERLLLPVISQQPLPPLLPQSGNDSHHHHPPGHCWWRWPSPNRWWSPVPPCSPWRYPMWTSSPCRRCCRCSCLICTFTFESSDHHDLVIIILSFLQAHSRAYYYYCFHTSSISLSLSLGKNQPSPLAPSLLVALVHLADKGVEGLPDGGHREAGGAAAALVLRLHAVDVADADVAVTAASIAADGPL